ncbi:MAG: hypothetical protein HZB20_08895, partial [Chloroflexi bacterium]|nr:hypothetical protein [Chloroflexota bacterium]
MNLTECLGLVLAQIGAGALLLSALLPAREIRPSFFAFQSFLGAAAIALATPLRGFDRVALALTAVCVVCAIIAAQAFRNERPRLGRPLMLLAGAAGIVVILSRVMVPTVPGAPAFGPALWWYPPLFVLGGLLLVGATHTAMILGHWYLLMHKLSFGHLIRFVWMAVGAAVARGTLLLVALGTLRNADPDYGAFLLDRALSANSLFFGVRVVMGLLAPLAFGIMALRCARLRA